MVPTDKYYTEKRHNERFLTTSNRLAEVESLLLIPSNPDWYRLATERANLIEVLSDLQEVNMKLMRPKSTTELYRSSAMQMKFSTLPAGTPYN